MEHGGTAPRDLALAASGKDYALRRRASILLPLLLAGVVAAGLGATQFIKGAEAAGAVLSHPSADCSVNPASLTFGWGRLAGTNDQRLEISLEDNGFQAGTFTSIPLSEDAESHTMEALDSDAPHFWRIVSTTASGEVPSSTRSFVPCGDPVLLSAPSECRSFSSTTIRVNWAPVANYEGVQYVEFDTDENWAGDGYKQAGPYSPALETLRRSGFQNDVTYYYRVVSEVDGEQRVSATGSFTPDCYPDILAENYGSDDRLLIPAINVDAPVNFRDVGPDGLLGVPSGGYDVIRYNFAFYPHLQGPTLIAGHYDYHVIGPAVFWDLATLQPGDTVEYWDGDVKYTYVVDWVGNIPFSEPLNGYIQDGDGTTLLLVTCFGTFDRNQFGGYDQRTLVHATLQ